MDARVGEESPSRRTGIKRPWVDLALLVEENASSGSPALLSPIDPGLSRRPSLLRGVELGVFSGANNRYNSDFSESGAKRQRFEAYDYNLPPQQIQGNGNIALAPLSGEYIGTKKPTYNH